jgi:hypothetical protein
MTRMTRRNFVKTGAVGLAVAAVAGLDVVEATSGSASAATPKSSVSPTDLANLTTVIERQLQGWLSWLSQHGATGVISECGWPNSVAAPTDAPGWNTVASSWLALASAASVNVLSWGSGRVWTPTYIIGCFTAATANLPKVGVSTTQSNAIEMSDIVGRSQTWGTNLSGSERSSVQSGTAHIESITSGGVFSNGNPGTLSVDYFYPLAGDYTYLAAAGVKIVRLPIKWERIQPVLRSPLSTTELGSVLASLQAAAAAGIKVVPELHNGAEYVSMGPTMATAVIQRLGFNIGSVNSVDFVDFWSRFSQAVSASPAAVAGLGAYGLMNEPNTQSEASPLGPNLFTNGNFTSGVSSWTAYASTIAAAAAPDATPSLAITSTGVIAGAQTNVTVTPGDQLTLSSQLWAATTPRQWGVQTDWFQANGTWISQQYGNWPVDATGKWTPLTAVLTVPAGAATARVRFRSDKALPAGEVHYLTGCTVEKATGGLTAPQVWEHLSAAAVTAIRQTGDKTTIWVGGHDAQSPVSWLTDHAAGPWINDPLNATVYDAHHYFDLTAGGAGVYANTLATEAAFATTNL